jgi:hypothetical protein
MEDNMEGIRKIVLVIKMRKTMNSPIDHQSYISQEEEMPQEQMLVPDIIRAKNCRQITNFG